MLHKQLTKAGLFLAVAALASACTNTENTQPETPAAYALGIGVTTGSTTANYVVKTNDLLTGTISPLGQGLTLVGYRDYSIGNKTVFAVGGFEQANVNGIMQDASGQLTVSGTATFDRAVDDMQQVDDTQMLALEYPSKAEGDQARFYLVNIANKTIAKNYSLPLQPLVVGGDYPAYTGMALRGNQLFVSHLPADASFGTNHVDSNYVAIYSYPEMKFEKLIIDTRTGPSGAFLKRNGLIKTENGDIYAMSSSNISNGFNKVSKPGGFLRIKNGETIFDNSYFFNTDALGGKVSHIKYIGNGLVFATISTIEKQTSANIWGDKSVKLAIIDVVNKKITDVKLEGSDVKALIHDGTGARSFPAYVENGKVYYPISNASGTFIYQIDVATATAKRGAEVKGTFVGGIFKIQ